MSLSLSEGYLKVPANLHLKPNYTIRFFRLPWTSPYYDEVVVLSTGEVYVNGGLNNSYDIDFINIKDGFIYFSEEVGGIEELLILDRLATQTEIEQWHDSLVWFYADEEFINNPAPFSVKMEVI